MRTLETLFIAIVMLVSASAYAADPADRSAMVDELKSIDTVPTATQVTERFPEGESILVAVATDTTERFYLRKRATTFLSMYKTVEAARGLEKIAEDAELRPFAIYTLARSFGDSANAALVAKVAVHLNDESKDVREWTIRGLRWMRHDDARKALEQVASGDAHVDLKKLAARSLARWKPAPVETVR